MDTNEFRRAFWLKFEGAARNRPDDSLLDMDLFRKRDLCPGVRGMGSIRNQQLLNLAYGMVPEQEAYLEVGTYMGKSLISAMLNNAPRLTYAVDHFQDFAETSLEQLHTNLERFALRGRVTLFQEDFQNLFTRQPFCAPIGVYFYDGAHDEESQYLGVKLAEPFLADEALVIVDDWRADNSMYWAKAGTARAAAESTNEWKLLYELPARSVGDVGLWWNGVGIFSFKRLAAPCPMVAHGPMQREVAGI